VSLAIHYYHFNIYIKHHIINPVTPRIVDESNVLMYVEFPQKNLLGKTTIFRGR